MNDAAIKPLPPDTRFELLDGSEASLQFAFAAKKDALGPHVAAQWGWDDGLQLQVHRQRFVEKPLFAILKADERIGVLSWVVHPDHARFGEFYLFEPFRGRGTGTEILRHILKQADGLRLPVRLEYLKWNPVGSLYRRHGFVDTYETETHFHLERPASSGE